MDVIAIDHLTKRYGRRVGIQQVSLGVPQGSLFGFLGPNGSGKTTAIRVLMGLLKPTSGTACIRGLDCWKESRRIKERLGYLPGDLRLWPWLTGRNALRLVSRVRGCDLTPRGTALADELGLELDLPVRRMSRGTRQKLGLVLALAHDPEVLILDEPTSGLDPLIQIKVFERLRVLRRCGHTVLFSSHTLSEVEALCDRVAVLREGRLVAYESLDTLRARARRVVRIRWPSHVRAADLVPPSCLTIQQTTDGQWIGTLDGSASELIAWAAHRPIEDISIEQPDLAGLFEQFYR